MRNGSASAERFTLSIIGMSCASCAVRVETALQQAPGVVSASVNFASERAEITVRPDHDLDAQCLLAAVNAAGYQATLSHALEATSDQPARSGKDSAGASYDGLWVIASIALSTPLLLQMSSMFMTGGFRLPGWLELALATPVQFIVGARFYRAAWGAFNARAANMDVLVVMGTSAAYFYSVFLLLAQQFGWNVGHHDYYSATEPHLYFEASAVIITLVVLGKFLEARARRGSNAAIRQLMQLRPDTARVFQDGREIELLIGQVKCGDRVLVRPGERIPLDGKVSAGCSEVDESLISGESRPIVKRIDDSVTGGSVNGDGLLEIRVTAVDEQSMLMRIVRLVEHAQATKAPVQRLVDKISSVFVPVVMIISLLTLTLTVSLTSDFAEALMASVAVLVIACPCALGLATPAAIVTGTGAGARAGILVKDAVNLERARQVDIVIFDKTGTLTEGRPAVVNWQAVQGDAKRMLTLAATVQQGSEHPFSKAVLACAAAADITPVTLLNFCRHPGLGVSGLAVPLECEVLMGSQSFMAQHNVLIEIALARRASAWEADGCSVIWVAADGCLLGLFALRDPLRASAARAVQRLRSLGIKTMLISGDAPQVACVIGQALGIDIAQGGILPEEKAALVRSLRNKRHTVAMVGDGVNDAPALAAADVGIAMGSGTDIAMETAGITLMRSDPALVADAILLSRATSRKIKQNLFWAFAYNAIGIPLAALGLLNPIIAGAAMAFSSLSVMANSLLLRSWRSRAGAVAGQWKTKNLPAD